MMVDRFRDTYAELEAKRSGESDLSLRQIVTLASLVEKETGKAEERPLVAAVYRNRLDQKMAMQADPTVVYALVKAGTYDGNIRKRDLAFDSPYNTYKYAGPSAGPDRLARTCRARGGARTCRRRLPLLRQPERRVARVCRDAGEAQRQRPGVPGAVLPEAAPRTPAPAELHAVEIRRRPA